MVNSPFDTIVQYYLSKLWVGPGDLPDGAVVALEAGGVHPVPRLVLLPDLKQAGYVTQNGVFGIFGQI